MKSNRGFMNRVYRALRLDRTELSWVSYDIGNSAFTMMLSSFIPIYFGALYKSAEAVRLGGEANLSQMVLERIGNSATEMFSLGTVVSTLLVALLSPLLGAVADRRGMKKRLFAGALAVGILFGSLMGVVNTWAAFLLVLVLAKIGYSACNVFYDSMLTDVTTQERYDSVSTKGYAWGYIGSCIPFIAGVAVYLLIEDSALAVKIAQGITMVWWAVLTIPLLKYVRQKYWNEKDGGIAETFRGLAGTVGKIRKNKHMLYFMLAYFFYIDGVYTIISMAASYGDGLGLRSTSMILALLVTQFVAFPFALAAGKIAARIGTVNLIRIYIAIYAGVCLFAFFLQYEWQFWVMAVVVGMAQGGIQALSRSYFGRLVPKENSNEFFGFFDIFGKAADILGPLLIFLVSSAVTGNGAKGGITQGTRYGVLSITLLFGVGLLFLHLMKREIGKHEA